MTIPEGYDGIAVDLGRMRVLEGGHQHHLPYSGFTFSKLVPKTLLTDRVPTDIPGYIQTLHNTRGQLPKAPLNRHEFVPTQVLRTTTAEGAEVILDSMVFWDIKDTMVAATTAMELLKVEAGGDKIAANDHDEHIQRASRNIDHLRETVLRIVKHHLTAKVGSCSLAGSSALHVEIKKDTSTSTNPKGPTPPPPKYEAPADGGDPGFSFEMLQFLQQQQEDIMGRINTELEKIGVEIQNICIYSVTPTKQIQDHLDRQTQARVQANTALIDAKAQNDVVKYTVAAFRDKELGEAEARRQALEIQAKGEAEKMRTLANAEADSIRELAHARELEAKVLESEGAMTLATIREGGEAVSKFNKVNSATTYYFGENPMSMLGTMFAGKNPMAGIVGGGK